MPDETVATQAAAPLGRDAILAMMDEPAAETAAPVEAVEADDEAEPVEAAADGESVEEDDTDEDESTDDDEAETVADPKAQKGLDAVRRAEKRHREKMDADRAEFAREREKHAEALTKVADYEAAAKRIAHDPIALLAKLGVPKSAYEVIAHAIFAESETGAKDPARAAQAAARLREREKEDDLAATKREIAEMKAQREADKTEARQQAEFAQYVGEVQSAATKLPLVAHMLKADPDDTTAMFGAAFERLAKSKKPTTPVAVAAEVDRYQRAKFKKLGVDPDAVLKLPTKPAATADKKPANGAGTKPAATAAMSREEILASIPD